VNAISFLVEPKIVLSSYGYWIATTPISSPLRIGVVGKTEVEARHKFETSLERWKEIHEHQEANQAC